MDIISKARLSISKSFDTVDSFDYPKTISTVVDYKRLEEEIKRLIKIADSGVSLDETRPSVFIFGPTGSGKSEIIKKISEECGAIFHKIEPQKVPIEELQGFPYIHENQDGGKVVKLASPTILPPSNDDRLWVLFLDEFNKADTESMAAIMNLVLNGEIGGFADYNEETGKSEKYTLPKKTVIIGAGNMREQDGSTETNQVNTFDIATAERWHRVLYLEYNLESWLESFALKPYTIEHNGKIYEFPFRIPSIILNYLVEVYVETLDNKAPFLIPKPLEDINDISSTFSPRAWTLLANNMMADFIINYEDPVKAFSGIKEQVDVLIENTNEMGLNGQELVNKIIASFKFNYENNISPETIYSDYSSVRDKVKNVYKVFGMKTYLTIGLAEFIKKKGEIEKEEFKLDNGNLKNIANVSTFFTDVKATAEDMSAFIMTIKSNNQFTNGFSTALSSVNKMYAEAYSYIIHTDFNKIKEQKNVR